MWVALGGGLTQAGELQWRSARVAAGAGQQAVHTANVGAASNEIEQAVAAAPMTDGPRSVVVSRGGERIAQAPESFDPFDAEMPSTDPVASPQPTYDPFDDPATEEAAKPMTAPNTLPAPSLEEAFEEPVVEEPAPEESPTEVPPSEEMIDEEATVEGLERARQGIDRELNRRETERTEQQRIEQEPQVTPNGQFESAPPAVEEETELTVEPTVPATPEPLPNTGNEAEERLVDELQQEYPLSPDDDYQYGRNLDLEPLPPPTAEELEIRRQQIEEERLKALEKCETLYDSVRSESIKSISLDIRLRGEPGEDFPFECEGRRPPFQPRKWSPVTYMWKASGLCSKPLYFEQAQLERYGHDWGPVVQPIMSGAHFFGTIPILPYKMGLETPNECVYTLGYYRPGSCAPYMIEPLGFTWRAAAFQAGAVTGAAFAIP